MLIKSTLLTHSRFGSGTHIGDGYILTCAHILRHRWKPTIITRDRKAFPATVIAADALRDFALLKTVAKFNYPKIEVLESDPPPGKRATICGYAGALERYTEYGGPVTGYFGGDMNIDSQDARDGDSGGPILVDGKVVTVLSEFDMRTKYAYGFCNKDLLLFLQEAKGLNVAQN